MTPATNPDAGAGKVALLPCPFCGEAKRLRVIDQDGDGEHCFVACDNCNADGGMYGGSDSTQPHEAVLLWNRRVPALEAELAEARAALVDHNDLLRSAFTAAQRDAVADVAGTTNYRLLADRAREILKRHHATSNAARAALTKGA